jgi:hypothetical protein
MTELRYADPLIRHGASPGPAGWYLILAATLFLAAYLAADAVSSQFADSQMPQPNVDGATALDWYRRNGVAVTIQAGLQVVSVVGLATLVWVLRWLQGGRGPATTTRAATLAGLLAVLLMLASSLLAWIMVASADTLSVESFVTLRTAGFVAGGTAHVVCLGLFVLLASRAPAISRPIRVLAIVAAVPALASPVSLIVYQGAVAILAGRLLCMIWCLAMSVSLHRRRAADRCPPACLASSKAELPSPVAWCRQHMPRDSVRGCNPSIPPPAPFSSSSQPATARLASHAISYPTPSLPPCCTRP